MIIKISSPVFPTEDETKVISAAISFFETAEAVYHQDIQEVSVTATERKALEVIRSIVHSMRVIDAVRATILRNRIGLETRFIIDKQAAYHGKFKLIDDREEEPSLGAVEIRIRFEHEKEFEDFMKWFVPPTKDGKIVQSKL
ncbi:MAG: hypothetical protein EAX81_02785 [Candidatus Thorarchaeota archaeon]|nr:hypothetical protein [Candidatus Thorarchaeota archaeon]